MLILNKSQLSDQESRMEALDLSKSFIIQAPAGSGKTELLIQRYLKLLTKSQQPEEVVAITFTNKAANEMKQRVLEAINNANTKTKPEANHKLQTYKFAIKVLQVDKKYQWGLLHSHKRMKILTLDALCSEIVNRSPIESKFGFGKKIVSDHELLDVYQAAAKSSLNDLLEYEDDISDAEKLLVHLDGNISQYCNHLSAMLSTRDQWMDILGSGFSLDKTNEVKIKQQLEENIQNLITNQQMHLIDSLPDDYLKSLKQVFDYLAIDDDSFLQLSQSISLQELSSYEENDLWCLQSNLFLTKTGTWKKRLTVKDGFPPEAKKEKEAILKIINNMQELPEIRSNLDSIRYLPEPYYDEDQWDILISLIKLLPNVVAELKNIFAIKNIADYIEMADCARLALGNELSITELALSMDYKIKHMLIDEMQDTSLRQYQFIEAVTRGWDDQDDKTLFLVGDPMQSIFRFRNAQVSKFLLSTKHGIGGIPLHFLILKNNYRSGTKLVNQFNETFEKVLPIYQDLLKGSVPYTQAIPAIINREIGSYNIHALYNKDAYEESRYTVSVINNKLEATSGSIAILVRSRSQLTLLLESLRQKGIKYNAIEIDRLTDLPEIIDLIAITRALSHRMDRTAWLSLLRGPMIGLSWLELIALVKDASSKSVWNLIHDDQRVKLLSKKSQQVLIKFKKVILNYIDPDGINSLRDRVELVWYRLNGPALIQNDDQLENIQKFFTVLEEIECSGNLDDPAELEQKIDGIRVSNDDTGDIRLNVMTIHKAKGLEFDHVILPSLGRVTRGSSKLVLNWLAGHSDDTQNDIIFGPIGANKNDKLHSYIQSTIKDGNLLELDRLIYVAFTRAIKSLDIIGNVTVKQSKESMIITTPSKSTLLGRLWPTLKLTYEKKMCTENINFDSDTVTSSIYVEPVLQKIDHLYLSPFGVEPPKIITNELMNNKSQQNNIEFSWVGENAKKVGVIVHRWLDMVFNHGVMPSIAEMHSNEDLLICWARNLYVRNEQINDVMSRVKMTITNIIEDRVNHEYILGRGYSELPITGLWNDERHSIIIDKIYIDDQDQHWVIDYKTSTHEGGRLSDFVTSEIERYSDQLNKYAKIYENFSECKPKVALYFPNFKLLKVVVI